MLLLDVLDRTLFAGSSFAQDVMGLCERPGCGADTARGSKECPSHARETRAAARLRAETAPDAHVAAAAPVQTTRALERKSTASPPKQKPRTDDGDDQPDVADGEAPGLPATAADPSAHTQSAAQHSPEEEEEEEEEEGFVGTQQRPVHDVSDDDAELQPESPDVMAQLKEMHNQAAKQAELQREQHELIQKRLDALQAVAEQQERKSKQQQKKIEALESAYDGQAKRLDDLEDLHSAQAQRLTQRADRLDKGIESDRKEINRLEKKAHAAEKKISDLEDTLAKTQQHAKQLQQQCTALSRKFEALSIPDVSEVVAEVKAASSAARDAAASANSVQRAARVEPATPVPGPVGPPGPSSTFSRVPDPSVLVLRTADAAPVACVQSVAAALVAQANIKDEEWKLVGRDAAKSFRLQFLGESSIASSRARA